MCQHVYIASGMDVKKLLHGPGCNLGKWQRLPPSCALLGGLAIGARTGCVAMAT